MSSIAPLPVAIDPDRAALLEQLVAGLDPDALHWLSGYVAGLARAGRVAAPAAAPAAEVSAHATVLYGSQTGNGRRLAERLKASLDSAGLAARLVSTADFKPRELANEKLIYLVVSTHGEGDPPDDARAFAEFVLGKRAPQLPDLRYAVFALGDSSYPKFCETGRRLDERLAELGARRVLDRVDADVDFETPAGDWLERSLATAREALGTARLSVVRPLRAAPPPAIATRDAPRDVEVLANQPITAPGAARAVQHLELAIDAKAFPYEPGDALGVWPQNPAAAVERIALGLGGDVSEAITVSGETLPLGVWLGERREITRLTRPFLVEHAERTESAELRALLEPGAETSLRAFIRESQVADVLAAFPGQWTAPDLVAALRPLAPRLYSIASSRKAVGDEAHLTVAVLDEVDASGSRRQGSASTFLAGLPADGTVRAFLEPNPRFRLPADPATDLIMIGAGTGVAPYRAFVQERREAGATGRHWLVFGSRHLKRDFLYQAEWLEALRLGELARLDVAFSRDQPDKRYVQHVLQEQGAALYDWLERGATLYVCGDAERMAPDVDAALAAVVARHGGLQPDAAREYLATLAAERRYLRDVY